MLCLCTPVFDLVIESIVGLHPPCPIDREKPPQVDTNASDVAVAVETPAVDVQVTRCAVETRTQQKRQEKPCKPLIVPNVVGTSVSAEDFLRE